MKWACGRKGVKGKEPGKRYAVEFLKSCDGTVGWSSLLASITADMIRAGTDGVFPDGHPRVNGTVLGFMNTIGRAVCSWASNR
jgi:hypothetical protein